MRTKLFLISSFVLMSFSGVSSAWGVLGHKAIVEIAQRHLTDEAKKNIALYMPYDMKQDAVWMDQHRKDKDIAYTTSYHTYVVDAVTGKYDPTVRYSKGDCVRALYVSDYTLRNRSQLNDSTILMNIRMMIHWVGDLHCPTHSYLPTKNGQKWPCVLNGQKFKAFHNVYDKMPELLFPGMTPEQVADIIDDASKSEIKKISKGGILDWVDEIAAMNWKIYEINPVPQNKKLVMELNPNTVEESRELCVKQMRNAGYRLAMLLNEYFAD